MNRIPLKNAIESGVWYVCDGRYFDEELPFRLRVLGFLHTTVEEIDESLSNEVEIEGILWLMSVEVINLCKKPVDPSNVADMVTLTDEDGFQFERFNSKLNANRESGLHRLYIGQPLSPKIKAKGAIAFVLPDEENSYCLGIKDGWIREA